MKLTLIIMYVHLYSLHCDFRSNIWATAKIVFIYILDGVQSKSNQNQIYGQNMFHDLFESSDQTTVSSN